jgi:hypothetical protein
VDLSLNTLFSCFCRFHDRTAQAFGRFVEHQEEEKVCPQKLERRHLWRCKRFALASTTNYHHERLFRLQQPFLPSAGVIGIHVRLDQILVQSGGRVVECNESIGHRRERIIETVCFRNPTFRIPTVL